MSQSTSAVATPTASARLPVWLVVLAAGCIVGVAMGLRQVMGLYLKPMTTDLKVGREAFSTAMAVANIVWGIGSGVRRRDRRQVRRRPRDRAERAAHRAGLYVMYDASVVAPLIPGNGPGGIFTDLFVSGVLLGLGVSGTGITALVGAVGRAVPPEKRTQAIASLGMAGGIGGFIAFPYAHLLIEAYGWKTSLLVLATTALSMLPLAWFMSGKPQTQAAAVKPQTLTEAFSEAFAHPSFWLLTAGFFVCGFHVAFYSVHLPAFVADKGLEPWVGVWALTLVGTANIIGTYVAGQSGRFVEKRVGLSLIYFGRVFAFLGLLFLPITPMDGDRDQRAARLLLAVDRAADLGPGRAVLRHHLDVDAVRLRVLLAPVRLVRRPVARRAAVRRHQVLRHDVVDLDRARPVRGRRSTGRSRSGRSPACRQRRQWHAQPADCYIECHGTPSNRTRRYRPGEAQGRANRRFGWCSDLLVRRRRLSLRRARQCHHPRPVVGHRRPACACEQCAVRFARSDRGGFADVSDRTRASATLRPLNLRPRRGARHGDAR